MLASPMASLTHHTTAPMITTSSTTDSATTTKVDILIEVGSPLFYIAVGAGSALLILLLIIMIMCASVCYLVVDRTKSYTITTESDATIHGQRTQSGDRENDTEWQWQSEFNVYRESNPMLICLSVCRYSYRNIAPGDFKFKV